MLKTTPFKAPERVHVGFLQVQWFPRALKKHSLKMNCLCEISLRCGCVCTGLYDGLGDFLIFYLFIYLVINNKFIMCEITHTPQI